MSINSNLLVLGRCLTALANASNNKEKEKEKENDISINNNNQLRNSSESLVKERILEKEKLKNTKTDLLIPYRDSNLTLLMKPFFISTAQPLTSTLLPSSVMMKLSQCPNKIMIVTISPHGSSIEENANVLSYGALSTKIRIVCKVVTRTPISSRKFWEMCMSKL
jgi:hypothetical protein